MINFLKTLDKKYALGLILAIFFGAFSLYTYYFDEKEPRITYSELSNTTIIDFKEDNEKIKVLYDTINIKSTEENLSLIIVKIENNGHKNILDSYYDEEFPLGIEITSGSIIDKPVIIKSSSDYLKKKIKITVLSKSQIAFSPFLFDKKDFFTLKFLVLHDKSITPILKPSGKVSGIKKITLTKVETNKSEKTINWRLTLSIIATIISLLSILVLRISRKIKIESTSRLEKINIYKKLKPKEFDKIEIEIINLYIENGFKEILWLKNYFTDYDEINRIINATDQELWPYPGRYVRKFRIEEYIKNKEIVLDHINKKVIIDKKYIDLIEDLMELGL